MPLRVGFDLDGTVADMFSALHREAVKLFGEDAVTSGVQSVAQELQAGTIQGLLLMNGIPDFPLPAELLEAPDLFGARPRTRRTDDPPAVQDEEQEHGHRHHLRRKAECRREGIR